MTKTIPASSRRLTVTEALALRFLPDEGLSFDEALPTAWLETALESVGRGISGSAKVEVEPLGPVASRPPIRLHGRIEARLESTCVRCLEPVEEDIAADVDLTLFAAGQAPIRERSGDKSAAEADGAEIGPNDPDEGTYQDNTVDLPGLLREALLLEVAMNPACEDEGACTERTNALLERVNGPAAALKDDRWAALRRLAAQKDEN